MESHKKIGTYKIPSEFKNEDKWFRFFTIPQLFALAGTGGIIFFVFQLFSAFGMKFIGILVGMFIFELSVALIYLPIPNDKYLIGGGQKFRTIVFRMLVKRLPKMRKIYVKNYKK